MEINNVCEFFCASKVIKGFCFSCFSGFQLFSLPGSQQPSQQDGRIQSYNNYSQYKPAQPAQEYNTPIKGSRAIKGVECRQSPSTR